MPAKKVLIAKKAYKQIQKLPASIKKRSVLALERILQNPLVGIKLQGVLSRCRKLRIGDYRVVYRFDQSKSTVYILLIEHRQGVYK